MTTATATPPRLARVPSTHGGTHTDLYDSITRVGSVWPTEIGGIRYPGITVVCSRGDWCRDLPGIDDAAAALATHRQQAHHQGGAR